MKTILIIRRITRMLIPAFLLIQAGYMNAQPFLETTPSPPLVIAPDHDWRIELEPAGFIYKGFGLQASRNITGNNLINLGIYLTSLTLPDWTKSSMFEHVTDSADVRLGFEFALDLRKKLDLIRNESDPYVGLIAGWEYFDISQNQLPELRITTFLITPFAGWEIYFYREFLYLNPQVRGVLYVGDQSSIDNRPEQLAGIFILPTFSVGVRF